MSSKTFLTISKKECLIVYKKLLANSDAKWKSAKILADSGDYGTASSMAIISAEEMIKALVLFFDGNGFQFRRVKGIDVIFNHHQLRYVLAYVMFVMSLFGEELVKWLSRIKENPEMVLKLHSEIQSDPKYFEKNMKFYLLRKFAIIKQEFQWFSNVDIFRQDGFYCDYQEQLKNPAVLTKVDYLEVVDRLDKVRRVGFGIIDGYKDGDDSVAQQIRKLKYDFVQEKYYDRIAQLLTALRQTRHTPFDLIKRSINGI